MNRQDFLSAVRQDGAMFRADNISIDTRSGSVSGKGTIRVSNGRFLVEVTLNDVANPPTTPTGIIGPSQFWNIHGLIENEIEFHFQGMPSGQTANYGHHPWKSIAISTCSLDLVPCGFDGLTTAERKKLFEEAMKAHQNLLADNTPNAHVQEASPAITIECNLTNVSFYAKLLDFDLIAINGQTITTVKNDFLGGPLESFKSDTFHGEFPEWKFGLIKREKELDIYFRSKQEYKSHSEAHDQRLFRAFLNAVAFTHGQHTWPFLMEYHRDGKLILDRVHLSSDVASTSHSPFTHRLAFDAQVNRLKWQFSEPLERAYHFFSTDSKFSREITHLLYLFREASAHGVPKGITLLALCSLFESLLHAVYDERIAPLNAADMNGFEAAKHEALNAVKAQSALSQNPASFDRIIGILKSATPLRPKDKLEAIIDHLQLKPKERWLDNFKLWSDYRNPLSHRLSENDDSEASLKEDMLAESKIAGAINCIILKLMGYSGPVHASAYEEEYIII